MLSVWWNFEGLLHFQLISESRAVNADLYAEQLDRIYQVIAAQYPVLVNRKGVLLQHDNGLAHRARTTQAKIQELYGIQVLPHPPYSPDLAPFDYGLFRSMTTFLSGQQFKTFDEVESTCHTFFASLSKD